MLPSNNDILVEYEAVRKIMLALNVLIISLNKLTLSILIIFKPHPSF